MVYQSSHPMGQLTGSSVVTCDGFVNRKSVSEEIEKDTNSTDLVFTNIIEISKVDFDQYISEE